jgi:YegS/Rv2252/BmrU family lipid kinase
MSVGPQTAVPATRDRTALAVIVNPYAGGGRAGRELGNVRSALQRLGLPHRIEPTRSLDHARQLAADAVTAGERAVAFGGDGLIAAVAEAVSRADGVLGVLPGGRGNDLVRALGIPLDPAEACAVLANGTIGRLDLGQVGSRTFIGIASCGFDSVANRIANETTLVRGNLVYAYGALRALAGWRPATFKVRIDDGEIREVTGYTVAVANSNYYGGGMMLAPAADLKDGMLDVVIIRDMRKLRLLRLLPTVFRGTHVRVREVETARARRVEISASRPFTMFADGDPIAELPVTVRVLGGAVRTILPVPGT